jgi:hypothetical protein
MNTIEIRVAADTGETSTPTAEAAPETNLHGPAKKQLMSTGNQITAVPNPPTSKDATASTAPPPLAALDAGGSATVISYQLPEPTSYEGRHIIALSDYVLSDFAGVIPAPGAASPALASSAAAAPAAGLSISVPASVVTSDSSVPSNNVISLAPFDLTPRLSALTWAEVQTAAAADKRIEVYRSVGGLLDYRIRDLSRVSPGSGRVSAEAVLAPATAVASRAASSELTAQPFDRPDTESDTERMPAGLHPYLYMSITAPNASNPIVRGPWNGVTVPVTGSFTAVRAGTVTIQLQLINGKGAVIGIAHAQIFGNKTWSAGLPVTATGTYTISVTANGSFGYTAEQRVQLIVALDPKPPNPPPPPPPAIAPSVAVTQPTQNGIVLAPNGNAFVTVSGTADTRGGSSMTVLVTPDGGDPSNASLTLLSGTVYSYTTNVELTGEGLHQITVICTNADKLSAPAISLTVKLSPEQPVWPVDRQLLLIEKIAISSFLGSFGASRVVKTFTLLPGEQTQISVDSYTKDESTAKSARSILDSTASECAADFEDTINTDNDTKASNTDATSASISADVGGSWGFAHADIKGMYSDQTNASRENTAKIVKNALAKHTSKASSNRSVNVNTDFSVTTSTGNTTDTSRTLKNINVSRVLNFVFRQMTQEHVVLTHLVDATLGYYKLDILLDASGQPQKGQDGSPLTQTSFTEYTLPEIVVFQSKEMTGATMTTLQKEILHVLTNIPDINGNMQGLVELVTPKDPAGNALPDAAYLRVKRSLTSQYTGTGGAKFTVPGILLDATTCVMSTDQLLCDAILGEGDALDEYSHALQDVAISERRAAVDERNTAIAREKLAQQIVASKDANMAATWQKIFPPPLSVPATITVPAIAPDGATAG